MKKKNKQANKQLHDSKVKNKKGLKKLWQILRLNSTIDSEKLQPVVSYHVLHHLCSCLPLNLLSTANIKIWLNFDSRLLTAEIWLKGLT